MAKVRLKNCEKNIHYLEGVVLIFLGACNIKKKAFHTKPLLLVLRAFQILPG